MSQPFRCLVILLVTATNCACASVYTAFLDSDRKDIYGGVRLNYSVLANFTTNGEVPCSLPRCESRPWLFVPWALADMPFSLVGDTLLLPFTVTVTVLR